MITAALVVLPLLVATGTPAAEAAPLGLVLVAAGSLAGRSRHLEDRSVNHRLGVTVGVAASAGAGHGAALRWIASGVPAGERCRRSSAA